MPVPIVVYVVLSVVGREAAKAALKGLAKKLTVMATNRATSVGLSRYTAHEIAYTTGRGGATLTRVGASGMPEQLIVVEANTAAAANAARAAAVELSKGAAAPIVEISQTGAARAIAQSAIRTAQQATIMP